jgi:hypothetical protein
MGGLNKCYCNKKIPGYLHLYSVPPYAPSHTVEAEPKDFSFLGCYQSILLTDDFYSSSQTQIYSSLKLDVKQISHTYKGSFAFQSMVYRMFGGN